MDQIEKELAEAMGLKTKPKFAKSFMGKSVVESTMERVKTHLNSEKGFFIISTHLPGMKEDDEIKRARTLTQELKERGLGYIALRGKYTREDTGEVEYEHSFFVPNPGTNNFKEIAKELCKLYGQESLVFAEKGEAYFLYQSGELSAPIGKCIGKVDELNEYWSKLKKGKDRRKFWAFESLYPINSFGLNAARNWGELF